MTIKPLPEKSIATPIQGFVCYRKALLAIDFGDLIDEPHEETYRMPCGILNLVP